MQAPSPIRFVAHRDLDKSKWDSCISGATNGLVYAYSFYLDRMALHWDALVMGDYEAVMPLPWNRKYGIYYLYQPFVTAQLGVFGKDPGHLLVASFLHAIPRRFRYWDFYLNHGNYFQLQDFPLYQRSNYVLNLDKPYEMLYQHYRENVKRNLRKALQAGCYSDKKFAVDEVMELAFRQMKNYGKEKAGHRERFRNLYQDLEARQMATTYGVRTVDKQLIASCVLFRSHRRLYYILVGNHPNGRTIGASHAMLDTIIRDHAGQNLVLDFEGSDIRNLAFFYSSFGAVNEFYAGIRLNRLPVILRWLKDRT